MSSPEVKLPSSVCFQCPAAQKMVTENTNRRWCTEPTQTRKIDINCRVLYYSNLGYKARLDGRVIDVWKSPNGPEDLDYTVEKLEQTPPDFCPQVPKETKSNI